MSIVSVCCPYCFSGYSVKEKTGTWRVQCQSCAKFFTIKVKAVWKITVIEEKE